MAGRLQTKIKRILSISVLLYFVMACKPVRDTTDLFYYHTDSIQPGDIILRKSYGLISDIITSQLKDTINISHCGIIAKNESGEFCVIHSLSKMVSDYDGMQSCSIDEFINDSRPETVKVVRFRNRKNKLIADYAQHYLKEKIPFDNLIIEKIGLKNNALSQDNQISKTWNNIEGIYSVQIFSNESNVNYIYVISEEKFK